MSKEQYDITIIGSGPAGLTAAIYNARAFLKTLVIGGTEAGGQLMITTDVENFPGFPDGILGPELMSNMTNQAKRFGADIVNQDAEKVTGSVKEGFEITTQEGDVFKTKTIILATGASAKWLGLESEQKLRGKGVSACATCDGFFFKDKVVAVVGGGDASMEEATYLTKFASKVYILVRKGQDDLRASKIMQKKAMDNEKIEFMFNTEVSEVIGDTEVSGLEILNNQTNTKSTLDDVRGLFIAIGHKPNTDFISDLVEVDKMGYVKVFDNTKTSVPGIFVAGDVADHRYRQAITAAGMGCMASLDAERFLEEELGVELSASTKW